MAHKLAVAIPSYDRRILLERLVSTVPSNTLIAVSDNGGFLKDGLSCVASNLRIKSHEIVLDVFDNWNYALSMVLDECEYLVMPSDDDLYLDGWYERVLKYISEFDADVFIFGHRVINESDEFVAEYSEVELLITEAPHGFVRHKYSVDARMPSVVFKSEFIKKIGGYDSVLFKLTAADSELIQRALLLGRAVFVPEVISCYRVWDGALTSKKIATKQWLDEIEIWTDKIISFGRSNTDMFSQDFSNNYADEVYARNLYAGLVNLYKRKEYGALLIFRREARWPRNALLKTKLRIIRLLLKAKILSYVS